MEPEGDDFPVTSFYDSSTRKSYSARVTLRLEWSMGLEEFHLIHTKKDRSFATTRLKDVQKISYSPNDRRRVCLHLKGPTRNKGHGTTTMEHRQLITFSLDWLGDYFVHTWLPMHGHEEGTTIIEW